MCLNEHHVSNVKKLGYIPVGLGKNEFSKDWLRDNTGENIAHKNSFYGEYTFYYWFWKNILPNMNENKWVGFSGYRYHWASNKNLHSDEITKIVNKDNFNNYILKEIPNEWNEYNLILGEQWFVDKYKLSKIIKHGKKILIKNPLSFLKNNRNIRLHFDIFHGIGNLDKAIDQLDENERDDFRNFTRNKKSFNRENLFICRSKSLMDGYFKSIFKWLSQCEKIFGFDLKGYDMTRIYAFLAERYLSYWFQKYGKPLEWPIFFFDTNKNKIEVK
tara:strand:- start:1219 stop:2037 length:819 start_codon:yes stop_codon:yes gene_type:complete